MNIKLSPSMLSIDFGKVAEQLKIVEDAGTPYIHLDVMDGIFVPNISFGIPVIKSIRKDSKMVFDTHLMIVEPEKYVEEFAALPGVKDAEGVVYMDLIARTEDMTEDSVYRFYAIPQRMNQISLRSGRMPQTNLECLVEGFLTDDSILGKTITISTLNECNSCLKVCISC